MQIRVRGADKGCRLGNPLNSQRAASRLYSAVCPSGTSGKRDLTHGAGAQGAHGVMESTNWTVRRAG
ncbi:hypothetical protein GCM10010094_05940 [Streptomyces flaveus]|uniref:Uncharacterized protein n=1 Tax=Streptomyces flaveus TaxID=66370 RepID=A0A917V8B6_9ACTN|nr:hypothetical protein GCM10010094_05940 [Streptomyces flaveus]